MLNLASSLVLTDWATLLFYIDILYLKAYNPNVTLAEHSAYVRRL